MDKLNLFSKLLEVQSKLVAPKKQYNSFGKYNYRSCEDIVDAVKPLLKEFGLVMVISDEIKQVGERYYIQATVKLTDIDTTDSISNQAYARESLDKKGMDDAQITGTTSSYARKYALNGMFAIDDSKDADTDEHANVVKQAPKTATPQPKPSPKAEPQIQHLTPDQISTLIDLADSKGVSHSAVAQAYKKTAIDYLTVEDYGNAIIKLSAKPDKQ